MREIQLLETTIDALVKTYDWYIRLRGGKSEGSIEEKVRGAIDCGLASLYADCLQLEAEEKRRREKARCNHE